MTERNWAWEAKKLLPHLAGMLGSGVTVQAGGGGLVAHALNSATWHTGTLAESQAPWAVTTTTYDAHVANVNAHHAKQHVLATQAALGGDHTISGATAGHVLRALGATAAAFAQLQHADLGGVTSDQHHDKLHNVADATHHTISGADWDVLTNLSGSVGLRSPSADVSGGSSALLRSAAGVLGLRKLTSTDTLDFDSATDRLRVMASNRIGTDNYASQVTGWGIDYLGGADFRYVYTDELHAKSFIADLEQALAGGQIISKSVAVLAEDFALPAAGVGATMRVNDLPSAPNMQVFVAGDMIRLRKFSRAAGSLTIADAWGVVTAYADGSGANEGTQTWTFTRSAGGSAGTATGTVSKDAIVLDYGMTGNGYYEVNAIDGAYALNSPYAQTVTWSGHPVGGLTVRTRMGNLRGLFSVANEYGFYAGNGVADANAYLRVSSETVRLNNVPFAMYAGGTKILDIDTTGINLYAPTTYLAAQALTWLYATTVVSSLSTIRTSASSLSSSWLLNRGGPGFAQAQSNSAADMYFEALAHGTVLAAHARAYVQIRATHRDAANNEYATGLYLEEKRTGSKATLSTTGSTIVLDSTGVSVSGGLSVTSGLTVDSGVLTLTNGTAAAPALRFQTEANMGLYRAGAGILGISTGSTVTATFSGTQFRSYEAVQFDSTLNVGGALTGTTGTFSGAVSGTAGTFSSYVTIAGTLGVTGVTTVANGTAAAPSLRFAGSATTGLYQYSTNVIGFATAGTVSAYLSDALFYVYEAMQCAGALTVGTTVNAGGAYKRDGVAGGIFVADSGTYLQDNNAVTWNGSAGRAIGTYIFNPQSAVNGSVPAEATALAVLAGAKWTGSANDGKYMLARGVGMSGGQSSMSIRHQVANVTTDQFAIIPLGTNGDFQVDVVGEAAAMVYIRVIGYFM